MGPITLLVSYHAALFFLFPMMPPSADPAPSDAAAILQDARACSWDGRYDESTRLYESYLETLKSAGRSDETAVIEWALVLGWSGEPAAGITLLEERNAHSAAALGAAGDLQRWTGDVEAAERSYHAALAMDENETRAIEGMRELRANPQYGVLLAKRSLAAAQNDELADTDRAAALAQAHYAEALVSAERYYDARRFTDSLLAAGVADADGRLHEARKEAERGTRAWVSTETSKRRAQWHEARDAEEARVANQARVTGRPRDAEDRANTAALDSAELAYADILVSQGRNRAAFDRYRAVQRRSPGDARPAKRIADLYQWEGRRDWARRSTLQNGFDWNAGERDRPLASTPEYRHTQDSESFRSSSLALDLGQKFDEAWSASGRYERLLMNQNDESVAVDRIGANGSWLWRDGVSLHGTVRLNAYEGAGTTHEEEARVEYLRGIRWRFDAAAERFDMPERALSVRAVGDAPLHGTAYRAAMQWMPDGPLRAGSSLRRTTLSDENESFDAAWKLSWALRDSPRVAVEYRGTYLSYTGESDLYWSPAEHRSHKGGVHVSLWRESMSLECEALLGRSTEVETGTAADVTASFSYMLSNRVALGTGFFHSRVFRAGGSYELTSWRAGLTLGHGS